MGAAPRGRGVWDLLMFDFLPQSRLLLLVSLVLRTNNDNAVHQCRRRLPL